MSDVIDTASRCLKSALRQPHFWPPADEFVAIIRLCAGAHMKAVTLQHLREASVSSLPMLVTVRVVRSGCIVRVESRDGDVWTARSTHVSDRIVGLRGWTSLDRRFRERDAVTLLIGADDRLVSMNARVLSASGTLMRVVRRDDALDNERRRAPRLRVELTATACVRDGGSPEVEVDIIDLSSLGCAIRTATRIPVGSPVELSMRLGKELTNLAGTVVRTWADDPLRPHAGIQFDPLSPEAARLVHRFLMRQLQTGLEPLVIP